MKGIWGVRPIGLTPFLWRLINYFEFLIGNFQSILTLDGDVRRAEKTHDKWNGLWNKYGLELMIYDYKQGEPTYPVYDLNPEIIESTYYLYHITGKQKYYDMVDTYWYDIKKTLQNRSRIFFC